VAANVEAAQTWACRGRRRLGGWVWGLCPVTPITVIIIISAFSQVVLLRGDVLYEGKGDNFADLLLMAQACARPPHGLAVALCSMFLVSVLQKGWKQSGQEQRKGHC
jgi:hypothetical protein